MRDVYVWLLTHRCMRRAILVPRLSGEKVEEFLRRAWEILPLSLQRAWEILPLTPRTRVVIEFVCLPVSNPVTLKSDTLCSLYRNVNLYMVKNSKFDRTYSGASCYVAAFCYKSK